MKVRIVYWLAILRTSYWFLPCLLTIGSLILAFVTVELDKSDAVDLGKHLEWILMAGPEGARAVLSVIATGAVTIASLTFSITIVALSLTSTQFGSRLLRRFMQEQANQLVLGIFLGTFVYSLEVLRNIDSFDDTTFVPRLSVGVAFLLILLSIGALIFFFHRIATSVNAEEVIASVHRQLEASVQEIFPPTETEAGRANDKQHQLQLEQHFDRDSREGCDIPASRTGYVQAVDLEGLLHLCCDKDLVMQLRYKPGDYLVKGMLLANVWPAGHFEEDLIDKVNAAVILGEVRTEEQDVGYAIKQLVQVALRALSPGINDPHTAMACLDRLGSSLSNIVAGTSPPSLFFDDKDTPRLAVLPHTKEECIDTAFQEIRQCAGGNIVVMMKMLDVLGTILCFSSSPSVSQALLRHVRALERTVNSSDFDKSDAEAFSGKARMIEEAAAGSRSAKLVASRPSGAQST